MKSITKTISVLLLLVAISAFGQKNRQEGLPYQRNGLVNFAGYDKNVLTVVSEYTSDSFDRAVYSAQVNALENILFKGIVGSPSENPIIPDEVEAMKNHEMVLNTFIFETGCRAYIKNSETLFRDKQKKRFYVRQSVTFDLNGIRKFLEKNNIIKAFGL
jgi:hypothetical protein